MCARYFTSERATNSSSSAFAGALSLCARQRWVRFLILQVWVTDAQGRGADRFYKWFHPKGARWRELLRAAPSPTNGAQAEKLTLHLYRERNRHRDADSPGSGAGKQGFRPLGTRRILVLVWLWVLPGAVGSLQRPIQLIVAATANGGKQPSPDHPRAEDKHNTVGTSLERVTNSLQGQGTELTSAVPTGTPREEQTASDQL